jgi:pimeloyl-ACP methyl ester carboxylesterase
VLNNGAAGVTKLAADPAGLVLRVGVSPSASARRPPDEGFPPRRARCRDLAAAQGFSVLTLDDRGVGLSRPTSLRAFEMDFRDWARLHLAPRGA